MKIKADTIQRYLARHAEPRSRALLPAVKAACVEPYRAAVVVPAFAEPADCVHRLLAEVAPAEGNVVDLVIVVVNQPSSAHADDCALNERLIRTLMGTEGTSGWGASGGWVRGFDGKALDVLVVDATGPLCFGDKEGVGRARKLGSDLALFLLHEGLLRSAMLGCSDADAILPANYFEVLADDVRASALLFPFFHEPSKDPRTDRAMAAIEANFRYYVLGLARAGSPYAYHALGSAMAVSLPHYAAARGFPIRAAGEDFYLLSKLAKLDPLLRVRTDPIRLTTRVSMRVPFGTGPRLKELLASSAATDADALSTYDPRAFSCLSRVLSTVTSWAVRHPRDPTAACPEASDEEQLLGSEEQWLRGSQKEWLGRRDDEWLLTRAKEIFLSARSSFSSCSGEEHRVRRIHEQFDALRTLQFIRRLTEERFPLVPLERAVADWGVGIHDSETFDPARLCQQLSRLEADLPPFIGPAACVPLSRRAPPS